MIHVTVYWENFQVVATLEVIENALELPMLNSYGKRLADRYTYDGKFLNVDINSLRDIPSAQIDAIVMQCLADNGYKASLLTLNIKPREPRKQKVNEKQKRLF